MRKKIWLLREITGGYTMCGKKPLLDGGYWYYNSGVIVRHLCEKQVKRWFDLDRHLKNNTCVQGYFNVSFTPIKKKK